MLGSTYWAGVLPGLIFGTFASIGIVRALPRTMGAMRHVLWLVPGMHFGGAFLAGPTASLLYGLVVVPRLAGAALVGWGTALTFLALGAALVTWRASSVRREFVVVLAAGAALCLGWLVPLMYHLVW